MMTLGQRIAQYRKAMGISQEELGGRLGVSRQAVSKWETDAAAPDMENLLALAREFGVSVAELTETPEAGGENAPHQQKQRWLWVLVIAAVLAALFLSVCLVSWLFGRALTDPAEDDSSAVTNKATPSALTEFALLWTDSSGNETFLELGIQEGFFPFGRELELTEPEQILDTDYLLTTLHRADCGDLHLDYLRIGYDPEIDPESPEQESVIKITTIVPGYTTPRGISVGSSKADVIAAYGDALVYCLKEEEAPLVRHDYYYAYQTPETFGLSLCLYMRDGLVAGIALEDMAEFGCEAFLPNNVARFHLIDGEPDFSQRQEPGREDIDDTQKVYIAWNQLVTNDNLSAEELYANRWAVFAGLSELDWWAFGDLGTTEHRDDTIAAFLTWIHEQAPYSDAEIFRLQMGVKSNLDGWLADSYAGLLSAALFENPIGFVKGLACGTEEDAMYDVLHLTAYDAELYPVDLEAALDTLDAALSNGSFTEAEQGWAKLLCLYLTTPIDQRSELPRSPAEVSA